MKKRFFKNIKSVIVISILILPLFANSQIDEKKTFRKAQRYFLIEDYERSVEYYKMLADSFPSKFDYHYETALLYFYEVDKKDLSIKHFVDAEKIMPKDSIPQLYLYLGQAYQANGEFDSAIVSYKYYRAIDSNFIKVSVTRYIQACELGKQLLDKAGGNTKIENLGPAINTEYAEYTTAFLKENTEMIFTSRRNKNIYDELIEALYVSEIRDGKFTEPKKIDSIPEFQDLVMDVNEFQSAVGVSPDGSKLIIYYDPNLYISEYSNNKWGKPRLLPENINFNYVTTHASTTEDGKHIYFSCYDRKSTGNLDIYHSEKQDNGTWGPATRLPSIINTRRKEDSPEISPDGNTLYFSSDGLPGMGGFDVFKTELIDSTWTKPENLGAPINSPAHDIYFHLHKGVEGTFSSNREGGYGGMDIYSVFIPEELPVEAFNDCMEGEYGHYEVIFDATKSVDPFGSVVFFEWEFGDKTMEKGRKVTHAYIKPGTYMAYLNVVDSITGMVEQHEKEFEIDIKNVNYLNFDCDSVVEIKKPVNFDASKFSIKDAKVKDVYWQLEQDSIKQGFKVDYTYYSAGTYEVKMKVLYSKDNKDLEQCIYRNVQVLSKEEFKNRKNDL